MGGFRFVHAADLHLDSPFLGLSGLPENVRLRIRESTFAVLDRLVQLCLQEQADFLLLSGDVYDVRERSLKAQLRFQRALERLTDGGVRVFVVHGNHDPLDGYRVNLEWPEGVVFFAGDDVQKVPYVRDGKHLATVYGISYPTSQVTDNLAWRFRRSKGDRYAIGLLHTNVDAHADHGNYAPCRKEDLIAAGMDYWALGHVHERRVLCREPLIVYPGNPQGRHVRETGEKGAYIADVSESGRTQLRFRELADVRWFRETLSIQSLSSEQELLDAAQDRIDDVRERSGGRASVLRLRLTGRGKLHAFLQRPETQRDLLEALRWKEAERPDFVWLESLEVRSGHAVERETLMREEHFLGDVLRLSDAISRDPDRMREIREEALAELYRHRRVSSYLDDPSDEEIQEWLRQAEETVVGHLLHAEEGEE